MPQPQQGPISNLFQQDMAVLWENIVIKCPFPEEQIPKKPHLSTGDEKGL